MAIKVFAKKAYEFNSPKGERVSVIPLGICPVPDWARNDPMFKAALASGNIEVIQTEEQKKRAQNGEDDPELVELRAQAVALGISRAVQLGKEKLRIAITEAISKANAELDVMTLEQLTICAEKNKIDISGLTTEDEIRTRIKESTPKG